MWKARHFCAELKISIRGFDYYIFVDPRNNEPDVIIWMVFFFKYGDILFLNMQKKTN